MINSDALNWQIKMGKQYIFCLLALKHVILALLVTSVKSEEYVHDNRCTKIFSNEYSTRYTCRTSSDSRFNISLYEYKYIEDIPNEVFIECYEYQEDNYTGIIKGLNINITSFPSIVIDHCPAPNLLFFIEFLNIQNVEYLELSRMAQGYRLQPYHFQKLNQNTIKSLKILDMNIADLPEQLFKDMSNLEELTLTMHQCVRLSAKLFESSKQLKSLYIMCDNLTSLETEIFIHLENLKDLTIRDTPLQYLPESVFCSLQKLERLTLENTNISSLGNLIFDNLHELKELDIAHNSRLTHLSDGLFQNKPKLYQVEITDNEKLSNLRETLFHNLTSIKYISLSGNPLTNLTENHFKGLPRLQNLYLIGHNLTENALKSLKENLKNVRIIDESEVVD